MTRSLSGWAKAYIGLVLFSLVGSAFSAVTKLDPGPIKPIASVLTIALGVAVAARPFIQKSGWLPVLAILALGTTGELVGLQTGLVFGHYSYSDQWWPTLPLAGGGHFPIALPFAWLLIVLGSFSVALRVTTKWWVIPLAGFIATLVDLPMEPVMTRTLGYWHWANPNGPLPGGAPIHNFVGWWVLTSIGCAILLAFRRDYGKPVEPIVALAGHLFLTFTIGLLAYLPK